MIGAKIVGGVDIGGVVAAARPRLGACSGLRDAMRAGGGAVAWRDTLQGQWIGERARGLWAQAGRAGECRCRLAQPDDGTHRGGEGGGEQRIPIGGEACPTRQAVAGEPDAEGTLHLGHGAREVEQRAAVPVGRSQPLCGQPAGEGDDGRGVRAEAGGELRGGEVVVELG